MANKPTKLVEWASTDVNLPGTGRQNKVEPKQTLKDVGWDKGQIPSAEEYNYVLNLIAKWIEYLSDLGSVVDAANIESVANTLTKRTSSGGIRGRSYVISEPDSTVLSTLTYDKDQGIFVLGVRDGQNVKNFQFRADGDTLLPANLTTTGTINVNGTEYISKSGVRQAGTGSGSFTTRGLSIKGRGSLLANLFHFERANAETFLGAEVIDRSGDVTWFELRDTGVFTVSKGGQGTSLNVNGDLEGRVWNGSLSNYLKIENPAGIPLPWPSDVIPFGWLLCDGSAFNTTAYPELLSLYPSGRLPDMRDMFIRGKSESRAVMSIQPGQSPVSSIGSGGWQDYAPEAPLGGLQGRVGTDAQGGFSIRQESQTQRETRPVNIAMNFIVRAR